MKTTKKEKQQWDDSKNIKQKKKEENHKEDGIGNIIGEIKRESTRKIEKDTIEIKSVVYKIINRINNKIYIGSALNYKRRFNEHRYFLRHNKHYNLYLQRSWNKYGEENFIFEILEYIKDKNNILIREQYYLDVLLFANYKDKRFNKLGYNASRKAESPMMGRHHSEKTKKLMSEIQMGKPGTMLGRKQTKETILKRVKHIYKPVLQYSLKGNFIKEWNSIAEAKHISKHISGACKNKYGRKTSGGFIWYYKMNDNYPLKIDITKHEKFKYQEKPVLQYDLNGNFMREWKSNIEAERTLKIFNIRFACKGLRQKTAGGYIWKLKKK